MTCSLKSCSSLSTLSICSSSWPSTSSSYFSQVYKAPGALIQIPEPYYATHDTMPTSRQVDLESPCSSLNACYQTGECKREKKRYEHEQSDMLLDSRPYKAPRSM
ncbi:unnamed protein product [Albugo candida]|uniref:Uncharacterized protein n=1 Tax=Albugo candida TaxID=65357 RepID=A0A024G192_9STRA|nr:unnamed protein product [Albugo candida]|eukprot:CCI40090.1 unnamed protein product [Albugo candida]